MKKLVIGVLIGVVLALVGVAKIMPKQMISEIQSPMGYEETIAHVQNLVTNAGWKVSALMRLDETLAKDGRTILPVASFKICHPAHAETLLEDNNARFLSVMMPCSIGVYEKADGKTYISTMNAALMGKMFGGTVAKVMAGPVAEETAEFIKFQ